MNWIKFRRGLVMVLLSVVAGVLAVSWATDSQQPKPLQDLPRQSALTRPKPERFAERIQPGFLALTVRVNDISGVAGFLRPGDHVSVLARSSLATGMLLAEDLKVLALSDETDALAHSQKQGTEVTLEARPEEAQLVGAHAQDPGLELALRHPGDVPRKRHSSFQAAVEILRGGHRQGKSLLP